MSRVATQRAQQAVIYATENSDLRVVPAPSAKTGILKAFVVSMVIIVASIFGTFVMNNMMVQTSYEINQVNKEINEVHAASQTMEDEILQLSSPKGLTERAEKLNLEPEKDVRYISLR